MSKTDDKSGGLAWAGSLVGSKNPENLGYRYSTPSKRYRLQETNDDQKNIPTNLQVALVNRQGETLGETLDLPTASTVDDLTALVQSLLDTETKQQYAFYASSDSKETEVTTTLVSLLQDGSISTEQTLQLVYQPLALHRVRPVTRCSDTLPGHTDAVLHVSFNVTGTLLASAGGDAILRFWDAHTNTCKIQHKDHVPHAILSTAWNYQHAFASGDMKGQICVYQDCQRVGKILKGHKSWITSLAWAPFGQPQLASASKDASIKIWRALGNQRCLFSLSGHTDSVECVVWGSLLYSASRDRTVKVWNPERGILVRTLTGHGHRVNCLAIPTAHVLRVGPYNERGVDEGGDEVARKKYHDFVQTHGEEQLVSGSDDCTLILWNPTSSKQAVKRMTGHQQAINHVAYSPDGRLLASASFDKKVKLWNQGVFVGTCTGHVGAVYQVAWSSDSRYLVSASKDSTAKLWTTDSQKAKHTLPGHADEVYALDWSPVGARVATGSKDRTIKIWKN